MEKKLVILDSHSLIHRAYHAIPPLTTKDGEAVNAVYGFFSVFIKIIQDFNPDYLAAAFDFPAPTFRHRKFKEYKAKRPPTPKELSSQMPKVKSLLVDFGIPVFERKGFEADDIIGTICRIVSSKDIEVVIVSGDMDILQLADEKIKVFLLKRGIKEAILCDIEKIKEICNGLDPAYLADYKGLKGDPSDNIPGVPGIGEKTAVNLIKKIGSLENIYQEIKKTKNLPEELNASTVEKLIGFKEQAFLSKELATIKKDALADFNLKKCLWKGFGEEAKRAFEELEFHSLVKRIVKGDVVRTLSLF